MERVRPYVGVSGVRNSTEALHLKAEFARQFPLDKETSHLGMIGIPFSRRKLGSDRKIEKMGNVILQSVSDNVLSVIHYYSDSSEKNLHSELVELLEGVKKTGLDLPIGLQLNIPWPDPDVIRDIKRDYKTKIIVQLGPRVMEEGIEDKEIRNRLGLYQGLAEYILIDSSGGRGQNLNLVEIKHFSGLFDQVFGSFTDNPVRVFAGGISHENVDHIASLLRNFTGDRFGIDAEKRLTGDIGLIDMFKARLYIQRAFECLAREV